MVISIDSWLLPVMANTSNRKGWTVYRCNISLLELRFIWANFDYFLSIYYLFVVAQLYSRMSYYGDDSFWDKKSEIAIKLKFSKQVLDSNSIKHFNIPKSNIFLFVTHHQCLSSSSPSFRRSWNLRLTSNNMSKNSKHISQWRFPYAATYYMISILDIFSSRHFIP